MCDLQGKVVLITGASSGIGAETSVHFAGRGCKLCLSGRNATNLERIAQKCVSAGLNPSDVKSVIGDLSKEEDAVNVIKTAVDTFGRLDVLVNNAGILVTGEIDNASLADYDKVMNINTRSVFHMTQLAIPHLIKTKGNIVNVSSVAGPRPFPSVSAYCMSKAAVDQLTKCAALELAPHGVRVNSVNPGVVITEIHQRAGISEQECTQLLEHSKETHALGRVGSVSEVAEGILFLASEKTASFITGTNLLIDGGYAVMCPR